MRRLRYAIAHGLMRLSVKASRLSLRVVGLDVGPFEDQYNRFKAWNSVHSDDSKEQVR